MQNSELPFYDEDIIDNFEVEELEYRLENKWGNPEPEPEPCVPTPGGQLDCIDW